MKHATQTSFGRPVEAVHTTPEDLMVDKWDALKALTEASATFDIGHRTLGVLKALMTFLPGRLIAPDPRSAIVFPSNKTLGDRLNGMPDSTLRRHLAKLVSLGIVSRHDSANRKRFARRNGQGGHLAFGFDLSPLAAHIAHLRRAAQDAARQKEALMALRAQVAHLRQQVLDSPLAEDARQVLRRKPDATALRDMIARLDAQITKKMSSTDAQNERHIQYELKSISDSERSDIKTNAQKKETAAQTPPVLKKTNTDGAGESDQQDTQLHEVTAVCSEYKGYFPEPVHHWHDLVSIADRLTAMMGIDMPVFKDAIAHMGARRAATVVVCMLERFNDIRNPGGYLRRLTQMARQGGFSERPLLDAVRNGGNCQLTT